MTQLQKQAAYVDYVQCSLASQKMPKPFEVWERAVRMHERKQKPFKIRRRSEVFDCDLYFNVTGADLQQATANADSFLERWEIKQGKHDTEGRILTTRFLKQRAIDNYLKVTTAVCKPRKEKKPLSRAEQMKQLANTLKQLPQESLAALFASLKG